MLGKPAFSLVSVQNERGDNWRYTFEDIKVGGIRVCFSIMVSIGISNTFFLKTGHHQLKAECKKMTIMVMGVKC